MIRLVIFLILSFLSMPVTAFCYDLLIVQSQRSPAYDEVLRGFRSAVNISQRVIVLNEYSEVDLQRIVREEKPLLLLTLGDNAYAAARKLRQVPVISLMALSYHAGIGGQSPIICVDVQIPPDRYLSLFAAIKTHRVGVICNPARNLQYLRRAQRLASKYGIDLVVREVRSPKEVLSQLDSLAGTVDALWMLPDISIATGEAADAFFHFSATHRLPVISFASTYLSSGAAIIIEIDRFDIGKQGGEIVAKVLAGAATNDMAPVAPRRGVIKSNQTVLRRLGIQQDFLSGRTGD